MCLIGECQTKLLTQTNKQKVKVNCSQTVAPELVRWLIYTCLHTHMYMHTRLLPHSSHLPTHTQTYKIIGELHQ